MKSTDEEGDAKGVVPLSSSPGDSPLAGPWIIYRDGQALGAYAAEEIRAALREGSIDPFDLVSREGSPVRRELVEVDEIFAPTAGDAVPESGQPLDETPRAVASGPGHYIPLGGQIPVVAEGGGSTQVGRRPGEPILGQGPLHLAEQGVGLRDTGPGPGPRPPSRRKRDPRHFHLQDGNGRVMGPLSGTEIQALYFKGVLPRSVKVMRQGYKAKVPVAKFIALYGGGGAFAQALPQGAHPVMPSGPLRAPAPPTGPRAPRVGPSGEAARQARVLNTVLVGLILLLVVATAAIVFKMLPNGPRDRGAPSSEQGPRPERGVKGARAKKSQDPRPQSAKASGAGHSGQGLRAPDRSRTVTREGARVRQSPQDQLRASSAEPPASAMPTSTAKNKPSARQDRLEAARGPLSSVKNGAARAPKARPALSPALPENRRRSGLPRPAALVSSPRPRASAVASLPPAVSSKPPPAARTSPKPSGPSVASLRPGETVTNFGPLRFDPAEVARCEGACSISFVGGGGSVKGVFFKQAWGDTLLKKNGRAFLTGQVSQGEAGLRIIISDVR